jgi:hypothetical protein
MNDHHEKIMSYNVKEKWHNLPPQTLMLGALPSLSVMSFAWHITQDNGQWA